VSGRSKDRPLHRKGRRARRLALATTRAGWKPALRRAGFARDSVGGWKRGEMAQAEVRTVTMRDFRRMDSLSGSMRVVGGSRRRRGVRWPGRASCVSAQASQPARQQTGEAPQVSAGSDVTCGANAGGSAHPSVAHAAIRGTDAELAKPLAEEAKRTPKEQSETDEAVRRWATGKAEFPIRMMFVTDDSRESDHTANNFTTAQAGVPVPRASSTGAKGNTCAGSGKLQGSSKSVANK
jgi:hypothetical protein